MDSNILRRLDPDYLSETEIEMKLSGVNFQNSAKRVRHADLDRINQESVFKSTCPECKRGILPVLRDIYMVLREDDRCLLCGQAFIYTDINDLRNREGRPIGSGGRQIPQPIEPESVEPPPLGRRVLDLGNT